MKTIDLTKHQAKFLAAISASEHQCLLLSGVAEAFGVEFNGGMSTSRLLQPFFDDGLIHCQRAIVPCFFLTRLGAKSLMHYAEANEAQPIRWTPCKTPKGAPRGFNRNTEVDGLVIWRRGDGVGCWVKARAWFYAFPRAHQSNAALARAFVRNLLDRGDYATCEEAATW